MSGQYERLTTAIAGALLALFMATPAFAQSTGRVVRDRATIWRETESVVAATVREGTTIRVIAQSDRWYLIEIPESAGGNGQLGLVAKSQVELLPGMPQPPVRPLRGEPGSMATENSPQPPPANSATRTAAPQRRSEPRVGVRGFAQAGYSMLRAQESFEAVLGSARARFYGAGAQIRFANGLFAQGTWERFQETGERVFVFEQTVYPLGIPNTITITPLSFTGGYRFGARRRLVPYVHGGYTTFRYEEATPYADGDGEFNERFDGYVAGGGVEFRVTRWIAAASEAQYTTVPDALGNGGVSALFGEPDLGGFQLQIKVLVGR